MVKKRDAYGYIGFMNLSYLALRYISVLTEDHRRSYVDKHNSEKYVDTTEALN